MLFLEDIGCVCTHCCDTNQWSAYISWNISKIYQIQMTFFIFEKNMHFYFLKKCVDIFSNFQKCWKCMILNMQKMVSKRSKINVGLWEKIDKLWHAKKKVLTKKNSPRKKKFETPKSCFLQSPETSKKLVKKIKLGDPNLDIQKFNNFPSFWSF